MTALWEFLRLKLAAWVLPWGYAIWTYGYEDSDVPVVEKFK